ncbi:MAG: threonine/serine exporter family protein [Oscillatoriales cyanobacterium C42_A2020_001]|nr:threonine/serine exporter family protein [Leptolyngbyaceae cyanobacterium C42_A2020_001]
MSKSFQDSLQPQAVCELADIMQVVMRVGVLMLQAGTVSFRVEQAMQRVALGLGAERLDAYVTFTGITASVHRGNQHYTQIARVSSVGVDMNRVGAVEFLSLHLPADASPSKLMALLDKIEQIPAVYPLPLVLLAVAIACGAFALLQGGGLVEFVGAAVGAGVGQTVRVYLRSLKLNLVPTTVVCAAIATLLCYLVVQGFAMVGQPTTYAQYGYVSSVLFQVPGAPLVTAALDLIRFDLLSGISRITYALILIFSLAAGIITAGALVNFSIM